LEFTAPFNIQEFDLRGKRFENQPSSFFAITFIESFHPKTACKSMKFNLERHALANGFQVCKLCADGRDGRASVIP
jgi:hypothetical protein